MKRRRFVRTASAAGAATLMAPGLVYGQRRADLVLRGATVFDGTGRPGREVDVALTGDRIEAIGRNVPAGATEIDLAGLALAPGCLHDPQSC